MNKSIIVMNWFLLNNKQKQSKPFLKNSVCYIFPGHPVENHKLGIAPFLESVSHQNVGTYIMTGSIWCYKSVRTFLTNAMLAPMLIFCTTYSS